MAILIASDCQTRATRLRHHLTQNGYDCPFNNVVTIDAARQAAASNQPQPDLIVFVLPRTMIAHWPYCGTCAMPSRRQSWRLDRAIPT